jgi:hypothetical protein
MKKLLRRGGDDNVLRRRITSLIDLLILRQVRNDCRIFYAYLKASSSESVAR